MCHKLDAILVQELESASCVVGRCVVVMQQHAPGCSAWVPLTPNFDYFRQAVCHVPVWSDRLPLLEGHCRQMTSFREERGHHLLWGASWALEFHRWIFVGKDPYARLLLGFGVIAVDPRFITCDDIPELSWPTFIELSQHVLALFHPGRFLFVRQMMGYPSGATLPYLQVFMQNCKYTSRWDVQWMLQLQICGSWVFLYQLSGPDDVCWCNGCCWRPTTDIII